ncbi:hypothetical protein [Streptomyces anulatus]|uniref:hypothetical protein n=1 Tax=Streptomyces anulatus TaxID=1892 RepID=UPI0036B2AC85
MSEFHVTAIYPVSFMDNPYVVGRATGNFEIGQQVTLHRGDGTEVNGMLKSMHLKRSVPGVYSLVFSEGISRVVQPGDVICFDVSSL